MSSWEERIAKVEADIAVYNAELNAATSPTEKSELRGLIKASRENWTALLRQQERAESAAPVGKPFLFYFVGVR
jgi:hypothetical protein